MNIVFKTVIFENGKHSLWYWNTTLPVAMKKSEQGLKYTLLPVDGYKWITVVPINPLDTKTKITVWYSVI